MLGKNLSNVQLIKFINLIKELRLFLAFVTTGGVTSYLNWTDVTTYMYMYNIHLGALILMGVYANNYLFNAKLSVQQEQITDIMTRSSQSQLRAEVRQAFKDYHEIEEIDFETTIKYLKALDERRIELGVNSYTEDMMKILLRKIKL